MFKVCVLHSWYAKDTSYDKSEGNERDCSMLSLNKVDTMDMQEYELEESDGSGESINGKRDSSKGQTYDGRKRQDTVGDDSLSPLGSSVKERVFSVEKLGE